MIEFTPIQPIGGAPPLAEGQVPLSLHPVAVPPEVLQRFLRYMGEEPVSPKESGGTGTLTELLAQLMNHNGPVVPLEIPLKAEDVEARPEVSPAVEVMAEAVGKQPIVEASAQTALPQSVAALETGEANETTVPVANTPLSVVMVPQKTVVEGHTVLEPQVMVPNRTVSTSVCDTVPITDGITKQTATEIKQVIEQLSVIDCIIYNKHISSATQVQLVIGGLQTCFFRACVCA